MLPLPTRRAFAAWAPLVLAVACHTSQAAAPPLPVTSFASGTRLRARVVDGGGDATLFVGWSDTELGEACAFARLDDGSIRCLPPQSGPNRLVYSDAACSTPAAVAAGTTCGLAPSAFVYDPVSSAPPTCESAPSVKDGIPRSFLPYALGAALPGGAVSYSVKDADGNCLPGVGTAPLLSVTRAEPAAFVAATTRDEARGERLGVRVITATDGAQQIASLVDTQTGAVCAPVGRWVGSDDGHCLPTEVAWATGTFLDASCSDATAYVGTHCAPPAVVVDTGTAACAPAVRFFAVGEPAVGGEYALGAGGACSSSYEPPWFRFDHVGSPIDPSAYEVTGIGSLGSGRLTTSVLASADGAPLAGLDVERGSLSFFDTQLGIACVPARIGTGAGALLCVPPYALALGDTFGDGACTVPLVRLSAPTACSLPPPTTVLTTTGCGAGGSLSKLGAPFADPVFYRLDPATHACTSSPASAGLSLYGVGDAIDPGAFAPLVEATR